MTETARRRTVLIVLLVVAACVFLLGINWGLPSRAVDPYLFGDRPVWSGEKIASLAPSDAAVLGADVDANPLRRDASIPIVLNDTDEKRAEIIRRYRLYSYQPDEMITFKSLSRINQFRGDPRLYQYGGLWMYPVGVMLKLADVVGFVDLRGGPDGQAFYLDHPEAFGRFYIVARFYTAMWGLVGVWAVFWIVHRLTASDLAAAVGALCYTFMPVVVNMAHEAKPHLPGAVLMLLSVMAATKYVETGKARWWVAAGALCGAAFAMVVSCLVGFVVLPVMTLLRRDAWPTRLRVTLAAAAVGFGVYFITNPYVLINAIVAPEILQSNLSNSTAMYGKRGIGGLPNALRLLLEATSPFLVPLGAIGIARLIELRKVGRKKGDVQDIPPILFPTAWLFLAPAALIFAQFVLLAQGKPGEYARFALLPAIGFGIATGFALSWCRHRAARAAFAILAVGTTAAWGGAYLAGFVNDTGTDNTRLLLAEGIKRINGDIAVIAEPAPYSAPPMNLFERRILLVDPKDQTTPGWRVRAVDEEVARRSARAALAAARAGVI
ncbi:MAG: glycosyltransferase family 39 protein [Tepidisphaeraceae bacterium]